jgi:hypothetical protein
MKRRTWLATAGTVVVVTAAGSVWRADRQGVFEAGEGPAYEPWKDWRSDAREGPLSLVRAALLASNPHNTQPWLFKLTPAKVELYADTARNLGSFDPYLREMHIGLGCAVENMLLAAAANGYRAQAVVVPGSLAAPASASASALVAHIDLAPGRPEVNSLHEAIAWRHTDRAPYRSDRPLAPEALSSLARMASGDDELKLYLYTATADRAKVGSAIVQATEAIIADATMVHDSDKWFRHRWEDVQRSRDGITLDCAGLPAVMTALAKMLPPQSAQTSHRYWLNATRDVHVPTAQLFGLIAVRDRYDRAQALRAGRLWQRVHLWATTQGIAMQPLNQPIELIDRERQLGKPADADRLLEQLTADASWKPTFAFRAGYPTRQAPSSPRRGVQQVLA